jgi:hypothetical protein
MKDGRMNKVHLVVHPKLSTCRKQQRESNTSRKINYEQQLLDILEQKSGHIDTSCSRRVDTLMHPAAEVDTLMRKTHSCCPLYQHLKNRTMTEVLGKDGNAGHCEETQQYDVLATVCAVFYRYDIFTTDK